MAEEVAVRQVSELQSSGAEIVAEARKRDVELRRYGETVAFVVSPAAHARAKQLEEAARRAYWGFVIARGLKSLEEGRVATWDEETDRRIRSRIFGTT
ncbi:MAG: hypothetical protein KGN00_07285 [Chloroflexota bacterium]|nr:hypothetical protein [Chloroflexota bacterium]